MCKKKVISLIYAIFAPGRCFASSGVNPEGDLDRLFPIGRKGVAVVAILGDVGDPKPDLRSTRPGRVRILVHLGRQGKSVPCQLRKDSVMERVKV